MKPPNPPRIKDVEEFWTDPPWELSPRCLHWLRRFEKGWRPGKRIAVLDYHTSAEWYGVYIWEYNYILRPWLAEQGSDAKTTLDGRHLFDLETGRSLQAILVS